MHLEHFHKLIRFFFARYGEKGETYFGLNGLDHKVKSYLPWWSGFYVEAGANDGVAQSNTCYFERNRNWNGLLIEPIPEVANRCRQNRPRSVVEQCALVGPDFKDDTITMQYCNLMSTVHDSEQGTAADPERMRRGAEDQSIVPYDIAVPAQTFEDLFDKHQINKIEFLSLDVEGFELEALKGLNFEKVKPLFMLIEHGDREAIMQHLEPWYDPISMLSMSNRDVLFKARIQEI